MDVRKLVDGLTGKNNTVACRCMQQLEEISTQSPDVYPYFDIFADMLEDENSYVRTRGLVLIAANARWDTDYKIDEIIDRYLKHIGDDKPVTARQCIKVLPSLVAYKPELKEVVVRALHNAVPLRYASSMQPLVDKDIRQTLHTIEKLPSSSGKDGNNKGE